MTLRPKAPFVKGAFLAVAAAIIAFFVSGCAETAKGFKKDLENIKKADSWFREHYW